MRIMEKNKSDFYYALYESKTAIDDEYGNSTGQYKINYSVPVKMRANVSFAVGEAQIQQFGNFSDYSKVILTENINCPIDENSVLFVDKDPEFDEDGSPLYDYYIQKVSASTNFIAYAIKAASKS
jgi:hypothetical protein